MPEIFELSADDFDRWAAHANRQLAESGKHGVPLSSPLEGVTDFSTPERRLRFEKGLRVPVGQPEWMRVWAFEADDRHIVAHLDLRGSGLLAESHRATLGIGCQRAFHRRGIAKALMKRALGFALENHLQWIDLFVFSENEPAISLYTAMGFAETGRRPDRFRLAGKSIDDVMMSLRLTDSTPESVA